MPGGRRILSCRTERALAQNVYDRSEFFDGYSRMADVRGWTGLRNGQPSDMLAGVRGKRLLDLGCGLDGSARWR